MKVIDLNTWKGKKHYEWFKQYDFPCYCFSKKLDVTSVVEFTKQHDLSFFITILYLFNTALNGIEEMRIREVEGQVVIYDVIHPAYTVMTHQGVFENCDNEYDADFNKFYQLTKQAIHNKGNGINEESYNDYTRLDQYYFTCVPWCSFDSATHPMTKDPTISVPRIGWCKYELINDKYMMAVSFNAYHAIDGYPLCLAFNKMQEYLNKVADIIKL